MEEIETISATDRSQLPERYDPLLLTFRTPVAAVANVYAVIGDDYAKAVQLFSEYDPQPPYDSGSPKKAAPETVRMLTEMHQEFSRRAQAIALRRKQK